MQNGNEQGQTGGFDTAAAGTGGGSDKHQKGDQKQSGDPQQVEVNGIKSGGTGRHRLKQGGPEAFAQLQSGKSGRPFEQADHQSSAKNQQAAGQKHQPRMQG